MKKLNYLVLTVFFIPVLTFSEVTEDNFSFHVGGAFNYQLNFDNATIVNQVVQRNPAPFRDRREEHLGGGFNVAFGHLMLKDVNDSVHGLDSRIGFGMSFDHVLSKKMLTIGATANLLGSNIERRDSIRFSVGATYATGKKVENARYLFDIIGLDFGFLGFNTYTFFRRGNFTESGSKNLGLSALVGVTLPGGMHYIYDNGFSIGYRHRLDFAFNHPSPKFINGNHTSNGFGDFGTGAPSPGFGAELSQRTFLAYNLTFSIGYVWGRK